MIKLIDLLEDGSEVKKRVPKSRLVYAWEFPDQELAYIGLTGDEKKRAAAHTSLTALKTTAVSRFFRETGISFDKNKNYKVLSKSEANPSGLVSEDEAASLECYYMEKYKEDGWKLLNLAKCGSLGGSVRDEEAIINSVDNFIKNPSTSVDTGKLLSGSDYVTDYIANYNQGDKVFNKIKDIITANNIISTNQLRKLEGEENFRRISKLIEDWSRRYRGEDDWQKKLFPDNTRGLEKPREAIDAFLAEPSNLAKDQLKLITKRTHTKLDPEEEKVYLSKLKAIIGKYNIKSPQEINAITGNKALTWGLSDHDKNSNEKWKDILFPGGYLGKKGFRRSKDTITESIDDREILRRTIQGFELIPAKYGFGHPYVTKNGKATSDLATRINTWIQKEFNGSTIRVKHDPTYRALNFFKS